MSRPTTPEPEHSAIDLAELKRSRLYAEELGIDLAAGRDEDPAPLPLVVSLAKRVGIDLAQRRRNTLTFARIEAGLIRLAHQQRRRRGRVAPRRIGKAPKALPAHGVAQTGHGS